MVKVLIASDGTIADLRATLELIEAQAVEARALFAAHAAFIAATGGTFPERRHLFAMVNRFMIGHYDHVIEWAQWALAETSTWPGPRLRSPTTSESPPCSPPAWRPGRPSRPTASET